MTQPLPEWTLIGTKSGGTVLERIWYPWYESDYQSFIAAVNAKIDRVTVHYEPPAPELRLIYTLTVERRARRLKPFAQDRFRIIIEKAIKDSWTEERLLSAISESWHILRGGAWAEVLDRIEQPFFMSTRHYTWFFRPYIVAIFFNLALARIITDIILPVSRFSLVNLIIRGLQQYPKLRPGVARYANWRLRMGRRWKTLKYWWFGLRPLAQKLFVKLGHGAKLRIVPKMPGPLGLISIAAQVGIAVGWALGYLIFDVMGARFFPQPPTPMEWAEIRAILAEAGILTEVIEVSTEIKEIHDELNKVEGLIENPEPPLDPIRLLDQLENRVQHLSLSVGDEHISAVQTVLNARIDQLRRLFEHVTGQRTQIVTAAADTIAFTDDEIDRMIEQKICGLKVFSLVSPQIEQVASQHQVAIDEAGADTAKQKAIAETIFEEAITLSSDQLKAYAQELAHKAYHELESTVTTLEENEPAGVATDALADLIEDLESLLSAESVDSEAYQALIDELSRIYMILEPEEQQIADHVMQTLTEIVEAIDAARPRSD